MCNCLYCHVFSILAILENAIRGLIGAQPQALKFDISGSSLSHCCYLYDVPEKLLVDNPPNISS